MVNRLRWIGTPLCYNTNFQGKEFRDFRFIFLQDEAFTVLYLRERSCSSSKYLTEVKVVQNSNFLYQESMKFITIIHII